MADSIPPGMLVSPQWVQEHKDGPNIRPVEVDVDKKACNEGHVSGAVGWAWDTQFCDTVVATALAAEYTLKLPLGLQEQAAYIPAGNPPTPAKIARGKMLYLEQVTKIVSGIVFTPCFPTRPDSPPSPPRASA